ncbi:prostatic spermine-binding protein [Trichophyton tonsurans CBS 112818]|uniref:Prostatic spermine-binding protein n=1 Tax=Trichophyton tonsurans (strain CBS 112818) TaxID=647933 RepID=F2S265_TRIT1|nr:prostatic spermine-binding protein [Trichophyton tonsurans CBS 112818]
MALYRELSMAEAETEGAGMKRAGSSMESLRRKKFKLSELPISTAQRTTIENLLYSFKKKGGFDAVRKEVWAKFNDSDAKNSFTTSLIEMAESEIEPVDRSDLHSGIEETVDAIISNHIDEILASLRKIRAQDIGQEAANAEIAKGLTTDAEYEKQVQAKRDEREKIRQKELEIERKAEEERKKAEAEEKRRQRELRKQREEEDRKRREEREQKRRAEREKQREEDRLREERREREREERYERRRREEKERYRERERERERDYDRDKSRRSDLDRGRDGSGTPRDTSRAHKTPAPPVDEKALEDAALELLLKEGKELAAKSRQKPEFDFEQAEALENGQVLQPANIATRSTSSKPKTESALPSQDPVRSRTEDRESRRSHSRRRDRSRSRSRTRTRRSSRHDDKYRDADSDRREPERRPRDFDVYRPGERDKRDRDDRSTTWINTGLTIEIGNEIVIETVIEIGIGIGTEIEKEEGIGKGNVTVTGNVRAEANIAAIALVPVQDLAREPHPIDQHEDPSPYLGQDLDQPPGEDTGKENAQDPEAAGSGQRQETLEVILTGMFLQRQRGVDHQNGEPGHQTEIGKETVIVNVTGIGTETEKEIETEIETETETEIETETETGREIGTGIVIGTEAETEIGNVRGTEVETGTGTGTVKGIEIETETDFLILIGISREPRRRSLEEPASIERTGGVGVGTPVVKCQTPQGLYPPVAFLRSLDMIVLEPT